MQRVYTGKPNAFARKKEEEKKREREKKKRGSGIKTLRAECCEYFVTF